MRTFSFLYRNERTATPVCTSFAYSGISFQFPLSERTNCNCVGAAARPPRVRLSVSSIGTNELQPNLAKKSPPNSQLSVSSIGTNELQRHRALKKARPSPPFSFLYRNERTATLLLRFVPCRIALLSVSSIGTNELQRITKLLTLQPNGLSVSSIGTNELQQIWDKIVSESNLAFSFLYRNERTATRVTCNRVGE